MSTIAPAAVTLERRHQLPYEEFVESYLKPRKPVIITGALAGWKAMAWTPHSLKERFGGAKVFVDGEDTTLGAYLDRLEHSSAEHPVPYLRDQILKDIDRGMVEDVLPFHDYIFPNWLGGRYYAKEMEYLLNRPSQVELFIGGLGTRLGELHYDFLHCHVALAQLYGRKQFWIYPPEQSPYMYADGMMSAIKNVEHPDLEKYPLFANAVPTVFVQEPGEIVVLPSGWWHTTRLLGTSIAVAVNFANATNWGEVVADACENMVARRPVSGRLYQLWLRQLGFWRARQGRDCGREEQFR